jgi:hypothetical protein
MFTIQLIFFKFLSGLFCVDIVKEIQHLCSEMKVTVFKYTSPWAGFESFTLVVMGTGCIGSCKSN